MSKTAYPAAADVVALLLRAGFTVAATEAGYAADAAADEFERGIGVKALAVAGDVTHYYDPPISGFLELGRILLSFTSLTYRPQGGAAQVLTQNTDFVLHDYSGAGDVEPYTRGYWAVEFLARRWTFPLQAANRRSIEVAGVWGLWGNPPGMPDQVFQAVLHRAGAMLLPEVGSAAAVARTQRTEAGVQTSWGGDPNGGVADRWNAEFERTVRRYRWPGL